MKNFETICYAAPKSWLKDLVSGLRKAGYEVVTDYPHGSVKANMDGKNVFIAMEMVRGAWCVRAMKGLLTPDTTSMLEKAISLAREAHKGQKDKAGAAYFGHVERVMNNMEQYDDKIVGVLHDVIEDSWVSADYLRDEGFSDVVVDAVIALTHLDNEDDFDYIQRVMANPIALRVKRQDNIDNRDVSRLTKVSAVDRERIKRYELIFKMLNKEEK